MLRNIKTERGLNWNGMERIMAKCWYACGDLELAWTSLMRASVHGTFRFGTGKSEHRVGHEGSTYKQVDRILIWIAIWEARLMIGEGSLRG